MGYLLCFSVTATVVFIAFATALLQTSIAACNGLLRNRLNHRSAQPPNASDDPSPLDDETALIPVHKASSAVKIVVFRGICQAVAIIGVSFFAGLFFSIPSDASSNDGLGQTMLAFWRAESVPTTIGLAAGFLVGVLFLAALVPTSFRNACYVQLAEYIVYLLIFFAIVAYLVSFPHQRLPTLPSA